MCCIKIDTDTLLANCLNACKHQSFSAEDLNIIVKKLANTTDKYIFSDINSTTLNDVVIKYPKIFCFSSRDSVCLCPDLKHGGKKLPMKYFNFGYTKEITTQINQIVKTFTLKEQQGLKRIPKSLANPIKQGAD